MHSSAVQTYNNNNNNNLCAANEHSDSECSSDWEDRNNPDSTNILRHTCKYCILKDGHKVCGICGHVGQPLMAGLDYGEYQKALGLKLNGDVAHGAQDVYTASNNEFWDGMREHVDMNQEHDITEDDKLQSQQQFSMERRLEHSSQPQQQMPVHKTIRQQDAKREKVLISALRWSRGNKKDAELMYITQRLKSEAIYNQSIIEGTKRRYMEYKHLISANDGVRNLKSSRKHALMAAAFHKACELHGFIPDVDEVLFLFNTKASHLKSVVRLLNKLQDVKMDTCSNATATLSSNAATAVQDKPSQTSALSMALNTLTTKMQLPLNYSDMRNLNTLCNMVDKNNTGSRFNHILRAACCIFFYCQQRAVRGIPYQHQQLFGNSKKEMAHLKTALLAKCKGTQTAFRNVLVELQNRYIWDDYANGTG